jgi:transcriptional regulator with XRE-family HTH domain
MNNDFHIGSIIRQKVKERRIKMIDFAAAIHCSRPNAYSIFHRKSINVDLLQLISKALDYDFAEVYNESLDVVNNQKQCIIVLETNQKKLDELQTDAAICIIHSRKLSDI